MERFGLAHASRFGRLAMVQIVLNPVPWADQTVDESDEAAIRDEQGKDA